MLNLLMVFLGGGIGSMARYLTSCAYTRWCTIPLPLATFSVNVIGAFVMGVLLVILKQNEAIHPSVKMALTIGFCGGLTTFSTFTVEVFEMIKREQFTIAFLYILFSICTTLVSLAGGYYWAKHYV